MIENEFDNYLSKQNEELMPLLGQVGKIKKRIEFANRLKNNWEKIDPSKVSDYKIRLESLKETNKYWLGWGWLNPARDTIQEISYLLSIGVIDFGDRQENYSEKKKIRVNNAHETFHKYRIKLENRKLNAKEWAYFVYTPKKKIWKELFSGFLTKHLDSK